MVNEWFTHFFPFSCWEFKKDLIHRTKKETKHTTHTVFCFQKETNTSCSSLSFFRAVLVWNLYVIICMSTLFTPRTPLFCKKNGTIIFQVMFVHHSLLYTTWACCWRPWEWLELTQGTSTITPPLHKHIMSPTASVAGHSPMDITPSQTHLHRPILDSRTLSLYWQVNHFAVAYRLDLVSCCTKATQCPELCQAPPQQENLHLQSILVRNMFTTT